MVSAVVGITIAVAMCRCEGYRYWGRGVISVSCCSVGKSHKVAVISVIDGLKVTTKFKFPPSMIEVSAMVTLERVHCHYLQFFL
jgi:hypothetical protein